MSANPCRKFVPNVFHESKCANCFKPKEEHSAQALECDPASRVVTRSGYLSVAPGWDFSIPLNRTKRWQRRFFTLYDDGELSYAVDEQPDTVPQASLDMTQVLEVTPAENLTGHPHSIAITGPEGATFIRAATREDARAWADALAGFLRSTGRHKRNATFPGTAQTRSRYSGRAEGWSLPVSSGSPPTRDKIRAGEKARVRASVATGCPCDQRARIRELATVAMTANGRLELPAERLLLHQRKGYLELLGEDGRWQRRWIVLDGSSLSAYADPDTLQPHLVKIELSEVTGAREAPDLAGFALQVTGTGTRTLAMSAVTAGIRSSWISAIRKAANLPESEDKTPSPVTPRGSLLSSDEEYRTASESGGPGAGEDWLDSLPPRPIKERARFRVAQLRRSPTSSRTSTLDSVSTDDILRAYCSSNIDDVAELENEERYSHDLVSDASVIELLEAEVQSLRDQMGSIGEAEELRRKLRMANADLDTLRKVNEDLGEALNRAVKESEESRVKREMLERQLGERESQLREMDSQLDTARQDCSRYQKNIAELHQELTSLNDRLSRGIEENEFLYKRLQEMEGKTVHRSMDSLSDLTNIDLDLDLDSLHKDRLISEYEDLKMRFEKAVLEIRAMKRELRTTLTKHDDLELVNATLRQDARRLEESHRSQTDLMAARVQDLTLKLTAAEKQVRSLKAKLQESREKRRSLSLKGRESFSISKDFEEKIGELEVKMKALETGRPSPPSCSSSPTIRKQPPDDKSLRRLRRKSLDGASPEPIKLISRLNVLQSRVSGIAEEAPPPEAAPKESDAFQHLFDSVSDKVHECLGQVSSLKKAKSAEPATLGKLEAVEKKLLEIGQLMKKNAVSQDELQVVDSSVRSVVRSLETMLRDKLDALYSKRKMLAESGRFDQQAHMHFLAEKMAYETVIIGNIRDAIETNPNTDGFSERVMRKEIAETNSLIDSLKSKLNGQSPSTNPTSHTSTDYLTQVLTRKLLEMGLLAKADSSIVPPRLQLDSEPYIAQLAKKQSEVKQLLVKYKTAKLEQVADALVAETLSYALDSDCQLSVKERAAEELWRLTRGAATSELVRSEIAHVLTRCAQQYESSIIDQGPFLSFYASEKASLELWTDSVESHLKREVVQNIKELTGLYNGKLGRLKHLSPTSWRRKIDQMRPPEECNNDTDRLLGELADILAHSALVDARIGVLEEQCSPARPSSPSACASSTPSPSAAEASAGSARSLLETDRYLDILEELGLLRPDVAIEDEFHYMFQLGRDGAAATVSPKKPCPQCPQLAAELSATRQSRERDLVSHQSEQAQLKERARVLERRLGTIDSEYSQQVDTLRNAYRKTLAAELEHGDDTVRQRYRAEIEQLRTLCEKGLIAMENSHRRVIAELEDKHRRERDQLRMEKDQALAEETQATLAALDAMRKAHQSEVQREVAKFKADFLRKMQTTHDIGALHKEHQVEMDEIRKEILSLSERYAVKCVESASLEEQLSSVNKQLIQAQQHIMQLDSRNKQLRAHLEPGTVEEAVAFRDVPARKCYRAAQVP